jgi:hypothetical protein
MITIEPPSEPQIDDAPAQPIKPEIADFPLRLEELREHAKESMLMLDELIGGLINGDISLEDEIENLYSTATMLTSITRETGKMARYATKVALKTSEQRDTLALKLKELHEGLENPWGSKIKAIQKLYDTITESHNEAFWESLPYDMASTLGWHHFEADDLYTAITYSPYADEFDRDAPIDEINEYCADAHGFTYTDLLHFRAALRDLVHQLFHTSPNYQKRG